MATTIKLNLNHKSYLRDPEQTDLGQRIVTESITLIDSLGFEQFTFKKLATVINSTEASIYRYFENKHKLLIYLISWYWAWMEYHILFKTNNIADPEERLRIIIKVISDSQLIDPAFAHIDESALHRIVVAESSKVYLTKDVDSDNRDGLFKEYKSLCKRIAEVVQEIAPDYPYPHALISTVLETAHQQSYFARHLPSLTEVKVHNGVADTGSFLEQLVFSAIRG
jgi:AcrR family transcriptional regulator